MATLEYDRYNPRTGEVEYFCRICETWINWRDYGPLTKTGMIPVRCKLRCSARPICKVCGHQFTIMFPSHGEICYKCKGIHKSQLKNAYSTRPSATSGNVDGFRPGYAPSDVPTESEAETVVAEKPQRSYRVSRRAVRKEESPRKSPVGFTPSAVSAEDSPDEKQGETGISSGDTTLDMMIRDVGRERENLVDRIAAYKAQILEWEEELKSKDMELGFLLRRRR